MSKAKRPTFVLRRGKAAVVVLNPKEFEAYAAARERQDVLDAVEQGRREFAAGGGMTVDEFKRRVRPEAKARAAKHSKSKA
jgi:PHD/YefM family antitoxin component YafN of YafNO toxin-antitoxin module